MPQRADATAAVAALVTVGGAVLIASIFAAFGLITTAENRSTVEGLVQSCLTDGIAAGIFNDSGNVICRKLANITMVWVSVVNWVKSWWTNNSVIINGGQSDYYTSYYMCTHGMIPTKSNYAEMLSFAAAMGASNQLQAIYNAHPSIVSGTYYCVCCPNGNSEDFFSIIYSVRSTDFSSSRQEIDGNRWYCYRGSTTVRTDQYPPRWVNSWGSSSSSMLYWAGSASVVSIDFTPAMATTASLAATYQAWTGRVETLPTSDAEDSATAEALPMNVPETVTAALDQSQTTAQTVDQAWTPPDLRGYTATGLRDVFPFCIPWDIAWMLGLFEATADAPHWEINYTLPEFMGGGTLAFNVDLEAWDDVAAVLRTLELIAFCVGLALMTKRLLGGD